MAEAIARESKKTVIVFEDTSSTQRQQKGGDQCLHRDLKPTALH